MALGVGRRHTGVMKGSRVARVLFAGLVVLGVGASVAACGDDSQPDATITPTLELAGKAYTLAEAAGIDVPDSSALQLAFEQAGLAVTGGCNTMSGGYSVVNAKLEVSEFAMTEMACADDALMVFDTQVAEFLAGSPSIVVVGDVMTLAKDSITLTLRENAPIVDSALEGTTWTVTGTVQGDGTMSLDTEPATLLLTDGTAEVFAGCNTGSATYTIDAESITFGPLLLTRKACEGAAASLESTVTSVLTGTVTYDIEGTKLTLFQGTDGLTLADQG